MVGGSHGVKQVWKEKDNDEKWDKDCIRKGASWGTTVMGSGMIQYGHKGLFHV